MLFLLDKFISKWIKFIRKWIKFIISDVKLRKSNNSDVKFNYLRESKNKDYQLREQLFGNNLLFQSLSP